MVVEVILVVVGIGGRRGGVRVIFGFSQTRSNSLLVFMRYLNVLSWLYLLCFPRFFAIGYSFYWVF